MLFALTSALCDVCCQENSAKYVSRKGVVAFPFLAPISRAFPHFFDPEYLKTSSNSSLGYSGRILL